MLFSVFHYLFNKLFKIDLTIQFHKKNVSVIIKKLIKFI